MIPKLFYIKLDDAPLVLLCKTVDDTQVFGVEDEVQGGIERFNERLKLDTATNRP